MGLVKQITSHAAPNAETLGNVQGVGASDAAYEAIHEVRPMQFGSQSHALLAHESHSPALRRCWMVFWCDLYEETSEHLFSSALTKLLPC